MITFCQHFIILLRDTHVNVIDLASFSSKLLPWKLFNQLTDEIVHCKCFKFLCILLCMVSACLIKIRELDLLSVLVLSLPFPTRFTFASCFTLTNDSKENEEILGCCSKTFKEQAFSKNASRIPFKDTCRPELFPEEVSLSYLAFKWLSILT